VAATIDTLLTKNYNRYEVE